MGHGPGGLARPCSSLPVGPEPAVESPQQGAAVAIEDGVMDDLCHGQFNSPGSRLPGFPRATRRRYLHSIWYLVDGERPTVPGEPS